MKLLYAVEMKNPWGSGWILQQSTISETRTEVRAELKKRKKKYPGQLMRLAIYCRIGELK